MVVSASPSFFLSSPVIGSIAIEMTGSGKVMRSRMIGWSGSQIVSPVYEFFRPMTATMLPASTASSALRSFACISKMRLTFSRLPVPGLSTRVPLSRVPE